jgi:2TM domain
MSDIISQDQQLKEKAKKIAGFYGHLFWFVVVNIFLYILDYITNGRIDWAYWVTFGWGIGIASHALGTFYSGGLEDKIYQDLVQKEKNK